MDLTDWIISISAAGIGILISITAYFAQKWISSVDETLKEHSGDFKTLAKQISSLEQKQTAQTENLSKAIETKLATFKFPYRKIDEIGKEVSLIKQTIQEKVLPHQDRTQELHGKVVVLEDSVREQDSKMIKMFSALTVLSQKLKDQK